MSDPNLSRTKRSSQAIDNFSFDEDFLVKVTELVRRNAGGTAIEYFNPATEEKQDAIIAATGRGLNIPTFDYASQTQTATTDTWVFKTGGAGGTTVATVVITYVDATKEVISSVAQS